ncbi:hypothetical protein NB524_05825 [Vibrio alginolyticus]|uniref:hypothetical protein n=1 Tax=Vibrio alginolyticus TaxID=663 RepID=UPI00215BEA64|nr:hypothetical protein [Vibrio alginolyticus]MCR9569880.1 hypothetical protein [Vibrio alginolyticus]
MIDLKKRIDIINGHLDQDTEASLLLAALEARLTIESICYDRFKQNHHYMSESDLKKWNPADIVAQVANEVSSTVNEDITLRIAKHKIDYSKPKNSQNFDKENPIVIGNQSKIKLSKAKRIWNALSREALHLRLSDYDQHGIYGNSDSIKKKVREAIDFFEGISQGNLLLGGGFHPSENFDCISCGIKIRKFFNKLPIPSVISCTNPNCIESYLIDYNEHKGFEVTRYLYKFICEKCDSTFVVPHRMLDNLTHNEQINITCNICESNATITMRPNYTNIKEVK